ncbi:cation transporting ATPase C-terminal domain-containing protein [Eubacteriales bacterium OttesenSCG-928-G02]|nr:cation transporting ATPase C-terminal domain-containing protein [Eubacteriales bacterium OttesenSCG-928-G02]
MPKNRPNNFDEYPKINTFTSSSAKRMSDKTLSFSEQYPHEIAEYFDSDITEGLSSSQVKKQRAAYGHNIITEPIPLSFIGSLKKQSKNLISIFLVFSAIMMYFLEKNILYLLPVAVLAILFVANAVLENQAGKSLRKIQKISSPKVTVVRDGKPFVTDSRSIVAGDIIILESGNIVPADARLIESTAFTVLETPINNIKSAVEKDARFVSKSDADLIYKNMVYAGTIVISGNAIAIVCEVGKNVLLNRVKRRQNKSNLPIILSSLQNFNSKISVLVVLMQIVMILVGLICGIALSQIFMVTLSLGAVSLLDSIFSLAAFAFGTGIDNAYEDGAAIKNLDSVENISQIDCIMCDKNTAFPAKTIAVESIYADQVRLDTVKHNKRQIEKLIKYILFCSSYKEKLTQQKKRKKNELIDKYEGSVYTLSLLKTAFDLGMSTEDLEQDLFRIETEFDSQGEIQRVLGLIDGKTAVVIKGTPEDVLSRCVGYQKNGINYKLNDKNRAKIMEDISIMSKNQVILAVAMGYTAADSLRDITAERKLVFIGCVGFYASMEVDSASAVYKCKQANIETIVSSKDSYYTALNLSKNAGIITDEDEICTAKTLFETEEGLFIANSGRYKMFLNLTDEDWLYIFRLRKQNKKNIAVAASHTEQLQLMKESSVSFVPVKGSTDIIKHSSDVQMFDDGFDTIVSTLKNAKLMVKRIFNTWEYMFCGFTMMFFWVLLSVIIKKELPLRIQDIIIFGVLINILIAISLTFTPMNRSVLKHPVIKLNKKYLFGKLSTVLLYSLGGAVTCMVSSHIISKTASTLSITVSLVTFCATLILYGLMCGTGTSVFLNKVYKNYIYIIMAAVSAIFVAILFYVPNFAKTLDYLSLTWMQVVTAIAISVIYFLIIQVGLIIKNLIKEKEKKTNGTNN